MNQFISLMYLSGFHTSSTVHLTIDSKRAQFDWLEVRAMTHPTKEKPVDVNNPNRDESDTFLRFFMIEKKTWIGSMGRLIQKFLEI